MRRWRDCLHEHQVLVGTPEVFRVALVVTTRLSVDSLSLVVGRTCFLSLLFDKRPSCICRTQPKNNNSFKALKKVCTPSGVRRVSQRRGQLAHGRRHEGLPRASSVRASPHGRKGEPLAHTGSRLRRLTTWLIVSPGSRVRHCRGSWGSQPPSRRGASNPRATFSRS